MIFRQLFDYETYTYTYLIADSHSRKAVLIDPVIEQVERDLRIIKELDLRLEYIIETHVHADHITGAARLREATNAKCLLPMNAGVECADRILQDQEIINLDNITIRAIFTPGHTDSHMAYLVNEQYLLTGDCLFIRGCGRTDFQSGNSKEMYRSIQKLLSLGNNIIICPGHDYKGETTSTVLEEKQYNPRIAGKTEEEFINIMNNLNLANPKKIMEAVPANQKCGNI